MLSTLRTAFAILATLALGAVPALAADTVLSRDSGAAETFEKLATDGHYISLQAPSWPHVFAEEVQVYGYRYGDVSSTLGTVVIWDIQPVANPKKGEPAKQARIITSKQFPLSLAPEKAGWFSVPVDPSELPKSFGVSVFTRSSDSGGLWLGLSPKGGRTASYSSAGIIKDLGEASRIKTRHDGRNWLVRLRVRDAIKPTTSYTTAQLSGKNFAANDDGTAEGFATSQSDGPIVKFSSDGSRRLRRVYVYGKLGGSAWFNTDRMGGVWVLNENYGILCHANLQHKLFTNEPGWGYVDLPDIALPKTFYVLIEPVSRPASQLLIGYDSSSPNKGSLFGSAGALHKWSIEAPEDKTNWMIRTEYR
jgi:hypothetical protein